MIERASKMSKENLKIGTFMKQYERTMYMYTIECS